MSFDVDKALEKTKETEEPKIGFDVDSALKKYNEPETETDVIQDVLKNEFDSENFASPGLRWSLARGDNFQEKQLRLIKKYPEGELKNFPQSTVLGVEQDVLMFRENPESQWKRVDPEGFDAMDVPEALAGSTEAIVGESVAAFNSKGASIFWLAVRQAFGATVGEIVEQTEQSIFDVQTQDWGGQVTEVGKEGAFSFAGNLAMSPFVATYNAMRGAGALRVGEQGIETLRAMDELDPNLVKKATPGLVSDNPAIRTSEKQSAALLSGMQTRYNELIKMLDTAVRSAAPGNVANAMRRTVQGLKDFSDYFLRRLPVTGTKASEGGKAVIEGVEEYSKASHRVVSQLYDQARSIEEPIFDLEPALTLGADIAAGGRGSPNKEVSVLIRRIAKINGPKELPSGEVLSVTDQLRNIRTDLWKLSMPEPGRAMDTANGQANEMAKAITGVLDNPQNTDNLFIGAWRAANDAAKTRLSTLEKAPIVAAAKSQNPADLVRQYVAPGQVDNLLAIRSTISPAKWNQFKDAAYSEFLKDPVNLLDNMKKFDQETLDVFMPIADQEAFRQVGREAQRIFRVGAEELSERQVTNRNFIDGLINNADPRDAQTLIRAMNNTNDRGWRDSVRAAIVEWSWDGVVTSEKAGLRVNRDLLRNRVKTLKDSGMWSVLSTEERRIIGNAEIVSRAFQNVQNAGTQLIAASAVTSLPERAALGTFLRYGMVSSLYLSSFGRKLLIGGGLPNSQGKTLRLLGASMARMTELEEISEGPE